jgi:hypothetical protein
MNPGIYPYSGDYYETPTVGLNKGDGIEYEEYYYDSSYYSPGEGNYPETGTTILYSAYTPPGGVDIAGPTEVDEGTTANFLGTIAGYGTAIGGGYSMDDTLIETFIDASGGTLLRTTGDDSYSTTTLPFDFEFFGIQYLAGRTIYISTNGYMDFGSPNTDHTDWSNDNIPSSTDPDNYIAPFWDDMRMWDTDGAAIYVDVGVSGGHAYMVIEWYNIARYYHNFDGSGLTFEVILWDDNTIDLRYDDVTVGSSSYDYGRSATVGLENNDGSEGVLYSYNSASLIPGMNIRYSWSDYSGTGFQWIVDGVVVDEGPVDVDPFYSSIGVDYADGPDSGVVEFVATYDGSPIDGAIHNIVVNNVAPEIRDYSSPDIADVGSDSWIHGYVDDVPADALTIDVEVSGVEGEDWVILPHASTTYEYTFDLYGIKPGTYTVTVTATDDDGDSATETFDIVFEIPIGALEVGEIAVLPGDVQAGGLTMIMAEITSTLPGESNLGDSNWHQISTEQWWCGDESLGTYGPTWLDALEFEATLGVGEVLTINHEIIGFITWDGGNLQEWDGTDWQLLYPDSGWDYDDASVSGLDSPYPDAPGWCESPGVVDSVFDLGPGTHTLRLVFGSTSVVHYEGWYINSILAGTTEIKDTAVGKNLAFGGEPVYIPPTEIPLTSSDIVLDLPDGWEAITIHVPASIMGGESDKMYAAISVPPGTAIGDYKIGVIISYVEQDNHWHWVGDAWWCGDDDLHTYENNYLDELMMEDIMIDQPYLRLNHYIEAESGWDGGNVQISTDDGATWSLLTPEDGYDDTSIYGLDSPTTNAAGFTSSAGYASEEIFDVSAYVGTTVDIKFVFGSDSSVSSYEGWSIYSVELGYVTGGITTLLEEDFNSAWGTYGDNPPIGWTIIDNGDESTPTWNRNDWHRYTMSSSYHGDGTPAARVYYYNVENQDEELISPSIPVAGYSSLVLEWDQYINDFSSTRVDYQHVDVSFDGGSWTNIVTFSGVDTWGRESHTISIPSGASTMQVRFHYIANNEWYWYVDNVWIGESSVTFNVVDDLTGDIVDPAPNGIVSVIGKMKANDLSYYRHTQTAMDTMVILALNLEDGMEDDGSMDDCLGAYWSEDFQGAHNTGNSANAKGHGYGYWSHDGGYGYFLNPGKNGNGMAGFSGNEAVD